MNFLKRSFILELVLFSAALAALNRLAFHGAMFGWNPSPLWAVILFIAMRHGSPAGIVAGAAAALLHLWQFSGAGRTFQDLVHRYPQELVTPALFILVGMYLGEIRERLAKRAEHFREVNRDLERRLDANEIKRLQLERDRVEMEKRIAGQTDTLLSLHENLERLGGVRSEAELWSTLTDIVSREMRAEICGVWRLSPPGLLSVAGACSETPPPLVSLALKRRGLATIADWTAERGDEPAGAELAMPLGDDSECPLAMAVSGMPFARLNRGAGIRFKLLAEKAAATALELRHLERLRRATIADAELGLTSETYLRNRIREEKLLARRHKTMLAMLCCSLDNPPSRLAGRLDTILACSIRAAVRASDGIAYFQEQKAFVVVLPQSDMAGAGVVARKIAANLETLDLRDDGDIPLTRFRWNAMMLDGELSEAELYERLFGGAAREGRGTA